MFSEFRFLISFTSWKCDFRNDAISSRWSKRKSIKLSRFFFDDSSNFRTKQVIVEQYYSLILTKKNRSIKQKSFKTSKMYFNYNIKQFTTLKNFYSFLINVERIEMKQFVSTINVLKLWKNKWKLLKIWFETKTFIKFDHAIIIINWLCLKKS